MRLKATIETKDRKVRKQLAPIVQIVNEFEGHLNRFYTHAGSAGNGYMYITVKQILRLYDAMKGELQLP